MTDCRTNENADSFVWNVKLRSEGGTVGALRERDSVKEFHGPVGQDSFEALPAQLHYAWKLALCRQPTEDELRFSLEYAANQLQELQIDPSGIAAGSTASKQVLVNFCHALMNSNEFVYAD